MDEQTAREIAWKILGEVEEMMSEDGVAVFSGEGHDGVKMRAFFEDREYGALENTIVGILLEANRVHAVVHAESLDGHDW
ncbi:MAG: hypothetical protein V1790_16350 [Planctomycetota bacterium]